MTDHLNRVRSPAEALPKYNGNDPFAMQELVLDKESNKMVAKETCLKKTLNIILPLITLALAILLGINIFMMITCAYGSSGFAIPLGSDFHQTGGNGFNSQYGVTFTEQYGETYHHDSGTYYGGSWNSGET